MKASTEARPRLREGRPRIKGNPATSRPSWRGCGRGLAECVVTKIRPQFPRLVVKYGGTHRLELPDPITAYLHAADVSQA